MEITESLKYRKTHMLQKIKEYTTKKYIDKMRFWELEKIYETIDNIVNPKDGIIAMCATADTFDKFGDF